MKDMAKDKILENDRDSKQTNVEEIQELLSNLAINKNKKIKPTTEDESIKLGIIEKEESKDEDEVKEDNSESEGSSDDDNNDQLNIVLHIPEEESTSEKEPDPDVLETEAKKQSSQDSDSDDANEPSADEASEKEKDDEDKNEIDSLKLKLALFDLGDDSSDDDDESSYLKRGPLTDHKSHYRFSPLHPQHSSSTHVHQSSLYNSPIHENINSATFDVEFPQLSGTEGFFQGFGLNQPLFETGEGNNSCPLSPESVYSPNAQSSPYYNTNFSANQNANDCLYQTEFSTDWGNGSTQFSDSPSYDFGNKSFESYQPLSPPKSVSPFLKDGQDNNQYGNLGENENLKESEDLISIIDSVNKTYNTNAKGIPESELVKLRSVLEGNEDSIRNEMGMYLKNDSHFQPSFNRLDDSSLNDSSSDYAFNFEAPLTPPKSVSPVQELSYNSGSPVPDFRDSRESDEHLIDILNGIDEINPDELNIYLEDSSACDPSYARNIIQARCKPNNLDHALRRLSSISTKYLCKKDGDGDTCLMIVYSKPEDSQDFYENIFCLQEKVREIRVCCDVPLGKAKRCKVCGNTDPAKFYTPLSLKNKQGDTALSCAVKTDHSPVIISYLLHGILQCPEDFRRVFDERGRAMLGDVAYKYPCLNPYL